MKERKEKIDGQNEQRRQKKCREEKGLSGVRERDRQKEREREGGGGGEEGEGRKRGFDYKRRKEKEKIDIEGKGERTEGRGAECRLINEQSTLNGTIIAACSLFSLFARLSVCLSFQLCHQFLIITAALLPSFLLNMLACLHDARSPSFTIKHNSNKQQSISLSLSF
ncbi:hypothetical protein BKA57DRAFT_17053 [Linnemannia elongata]|nr:hypothetical protein BKA57DRAFT_17053 [Linnemannia elongata]